jgi:ribosomal RNA-processing protein 8
MAKNRKRRVQHHCQHDDDKSISHISSSKKAKTNSPTSHPKAPVDPASTGTSSWSKSKKKRMRKLIAKQHGVGGGESTSRVLPSSEAHGVNETDTDATEYDRIAPKSIKSSSIQEAFRARLAGSRFRLLNEELYTTTSQESFERFKANPELFEEYHNGFRSQVSSWPENPVDVIVRSLKKMYGGQQKSTTKMITKGENHRTIVVDMGCGDAKLARDLLAIPERPFTVHSFDLVAPNKLVTACDMANVPLGSKTVDVCVFCLALMGTNLADFLREAHRILKDDGRVMLAEVRSRIEYGESQNQRNRNNDDDGRLHHQEQMKVTGKGTLKEFILVLDKLGFQCVRTDRSNKMFLLLDLKKNGKNPDKKLWFSAKPCIYKKR